jgi:hypothetical protein
VRMGSVRNAKRVEARKEFLGGQRWGGHRRRTMRPAQWESKPCKAGLPD